MSPSSHRRLGLRRSPGRSPSKNSRHAASSLAATIRRLSDADVRAIFESLHDGTPPPAHITFQIVPVGPNGLKLSPPSFEFKDGLYVLLRPEKKRKAGQPIGDRPQAPPHLHRFLMEETLPETCPWSLSGPQFPQPTAIQQRYCYPKGRPEYSSRKGGALWTMYGADGKEDLEFRLLHVYYSAKRAVNKGMSLNDAEERDENNNMLSEDSPSTPDKFVSPNKRSKRSPSSNSPDALSFSSPYRSLPPRRFYPQHHHHQQQQHHHQESPAITASTINSSSLCSSPLSFDILPPDGPHDASSIESPALSFGRTSHGLHLDHFRRSQLPQLEHHQHHRTGSDSTMLIESPFRNRSVPHNIRPMTPLQRSTPCKDDDRINTDPFPYDLDASWHDIDSYWNDPLLRIVLKPSHDEDGTHDAASAATSEGEAKTTGKATDATPVKGLATRLETLHESIRDRILSAPVPDQPMMVSMVASWARQMARDPLSSTFALHDAEMAFAYRHANGGTDHYGRGKPERALHPDTTVQEGRDDDDEEEEEEDDEDESSAFHISKEAQSAAV